MENKFAVIIATYQRKKNNTAEYIKRVSDFLNNQTYKNFKIFLIGDKYKNSEEFEGFKKLFNNDIFIFNNDKCYRNDVFKINENKWCSGGLLARWKGIKQANDENFNYYLHLDDDDIWKKNHIENINKNVTLFPKIDFLIIKSNYKNTILPRQKITQIKYNNYNILKYDSVHSSWCINLKTLMPHLTLLYEFRINRIKRFMEKKEKEILLPPFDSCILIFLSNLQKNKKINCICSTFNTVTKNTDHNIPA